MQILNWLMAHGVDILVSLLFIDKALERLFPNLPIFQQVDKTLSEVVPQDQQK